MAWNNYNQQEADGKVSDWNAAALKMKRLDGEFTGINQVNGNLLAFNMEYGVYNYQVRFKKIDNQFLEVDSKLSDDEKKKGEELRNKILVLLERFPIHKRKKDIKGGRVVINKYAFKILDELLFEYDRLVRKFIDDHGMDTSYDDESALF